MNFSKELKTKTFAPVELLPVTTIEPIGGWPAIGLGEVWKEREPV